MFILVDLSEDMVDSDADNGDDRDMDPDAELSKPPNLDFSYLVFNHYI